VNTQDGFDEDRSWRRTATVAVVAAIALCAIVGWFIVRPAIPDGTDDAPLVAAVPPVPTDEESVATDPVETEPTEALTTVPRTTVRVTAPPTAAPTSTLVSADDGADDEAAGEDSEDDDAGDDGTGEADATASATSDPQTGDVDGAGDGSGTTTTGAPTTTVAPPTGPVTYDTLPDGSPAPVVAVYGADRITITGAVPSLAAKERLEALAIANAKPGQANSIANFLTVNPDVPIGVGVRVVELTSARFPESSALVLPAHGAELNRAVAIMNALPNVTALVIGHADQRGDPQVNYALSEQRADSVVNYMVGQGIAPSRLSSRAVGANDLLTLNDDAVSLALNRRTEFVFYGLLVD
jgi:outer membrane protein OmpA-like peptidoglycan-associated protein